MVKPLCVFKSVKLTNDAKVAGDKGWSDIPTCKEQGIAIDNYSMPRTVWLPAGVDQDVVKFYADLMRKVSETPEWTKYLTDTSQSPSYLAGDDFKAAIEMDGEAVGEVLKREGWLAN